MEPKTLLIYPYIKGAVPTVPIGLAYLAGVLVSYGYPVKIIDAIADQMDDAQLVKAIQAYEPDFIGISAMFSQYAGNAHNAAYLAKLSYPGAKVVFGGAYASSNVESVLKDINVDFVVQGEGEVALLNIIRGYAKDRYVQMPYLQDLDKIPFPVRNLLPMDKYFAVHSPYVLRYPATPVISSRGCPMRCIYCSIHSVWGDTWRDRSAKNVVDEIEMLIHDYGIREIQFNDDNVSASHVRMHEICDEIINRKLDIRWTTPNGIALWTLSKNLIRKMKRAGCYRLTFGIETGSPRMQRYIRKNLNLEFAKRVIKWANDEGLWTVCTHIFGFPAETRKDVDDTINFAIKSKPDFALFYNLSIFKGTQVDMLLDKVNFTEKEVQEIQAKAYGRFMLAKLWSNPLRLLRKFYSLEMFWYAIRLCGMYFKVGKRLMKFRRMSTKLMYK